MSLWGRYKLRIERKRRRVRSLRKRRELTPVNDQTSLINPDDILVFSTLRNEKDWDVYVTSIENPEQRQCILQKEGVWVPIQFSPDDKNIILLNYLSTNKSFIYNYNFKKKKLTI